MVIASEIISVQISFSLNQNVCTYNDFETYEALNSLVSSVEGKK